MFSRLYARICKYEDHTRKEHTIIDNKLVDFLILISGFLLLRYMVKSDNRIVIVSKIVTKG
jgi:hypothetical protein